MKVTHILISILLPHEQSNLPNDRFVPALLNGGFWYDVNNIEQLTQGQQSV